MRNLSISIWAFKRLLVMSCFSYPPIVIDPRGQSPELWCSYHGCPSLSLVGASLLQQEHQFTYSTRDCWGSTVTVQRFLKSFEPHPQWAYRLTTHLTYVTKCYNGGMEGAWKTYLNLPWVLREPSKEEWMLELGTDLMKEQEHLS